MRLLREENLDNVVFIDIETASGQEKLLVDTPDYEAWKYKVERSSKEEGIDIIDNYRDNAALFPEFSRVVCISVGRIKDGKVFITTYKDRDEAVMLGKFNSDLNEVVKSNPKTKLCGHSVKGFDMPFLFRRCLAKSIIPNSLIDTGGLKPWELTAIDTKELWKGSGYYGASLVAVCLALGIDSPKSDITGAEVGEVYYSEGDEGLDRIVRYCERDVLAVINVVRKCRLEDVFDSYEVKEPKEAIVDNLINRICTKGMISDADKIEILSKVKGSKYDEKEKMIKVLKAALIVSKNVMSEELELEILKA